MIAITIIAILIVIILKTILKTKIFVIELIKGYSSHIILQFGIPLYRYKYIPAITPHVKIYPPQ